MTAFSEAIGGAPLPIVNALNGGPLDAPPRDGATLAATPRLDPQWLSIGTAA